MRVVLGGITSDAEAEENPDIGMPFGRSKQWGRRGEIMVEQGHLVYNI